MVGSLGGFIYRVNNDLVFLLLAAIIMVAEAASWYFTLKIMGCSQFFVRLILTTTWFNGTPHQMKVK